MAARVNCTFGPTEFDLDGVETIDRPNLDYLYFRSNITLWFSPVSNWFGLILTSEFRRDPF